jgi:hypothetical protein
MTFDPAIEKDVLGWRFFSGEDVGGPRRTRCFSVRGDVPSKEGLGRAERVANRFPGQRSKLIGFERNFLC